ncbi:hypothetical protein C0J52_02011 [Blattella germanica]|nr:hypothetical protein C0J52_02011 [Blattella germanica]
MAEKSNEEKKTVENKNEDTKPSPYSDAVYKELSRINGRINQMSKVAIISKLKQLKLSTEGTCEVLKKRLKNHYKVQKLNGAHILAASHLVPYYVIVDFEATCQEVNAPDYPHEIIEFPAVLVNTEKQKIVDQFQSYCRPVVNPTLSPFCKELTGITQEQVEAADTFPVVLDNFEAWLKKNNLGTKHKFNIVTDGPWDMGRFMYGQCKQMLEHLALEFEGRPHCGLDDANNIARVLLRMINDGAGMQVNERIHMNRRDQSDRIFEPVTHFERNVTHKMLMLEISNRECSKEIVSDEDEDIEKKGAG